jgi:hypothetical protein
VRLDEWFGSKAAVPASIEVPGVGCARIVPGEARAWFPLDCDLERLESASCAAAGLGGPGKGRLDGTAEDEAAAGAGLGACDVGSVDATRPLWGYVG